MAVRKSHNILALVTQGFQDFTHTTVTSLRGYISKVPVLQKSVVVASLVISTVLLVIFRPIRRKMEVINQSKEGYLQKIKKWRFVKMSFSAIGAILSTAEYLISPSYDEQPKEKRSPKAASPGGGGVGMDSSMSVPTEMNGVPKLLNLRHMPSNSLGGGTPNNNEKPSEGDGENWTPFSSVSGIDESVFDRSCVSLMDDLSQSTVSTPIRDIRQQMASKIRTWRLAIRDLEGTPEFPSWSPDSNSQRRSKRNSSWMSRVWFSLTGWLPFGSPDSPIPTSAQRKRKRLEGDDDDELALYIPHHKDKPKDKDLKPVEPSPGIRGLSVVPIIGNWFSSETSAKDIFPTKKKEIESDLDHIALIQRDNCCDVPPQNGEEKSEAVSDSEPYEILDAETQVVVEVHSSKEQNTTSSSSGSESD